MEPITIEQARQLLLSGQVSHSDLAWTQGMAEWQPLSAFPELSNVPPPPAVPGRNVSPMVPTQAETEPMAIISLVLGIISVVGGLACFVGAIAAIPAVILGHLGRSKIKKNPSLKGAGIALAGLITGYTGLAVGAIAPIAVIAAIAIPNIAGITNAANTAKAQRNAQNMASVAAASRAAGYEGKWASKEDAMRELAAGLTVSTFTFKIDGLTPKDREEASKYLELQGDNLIYQPNQ